MNDKTMKNINLGGITYIDEVEGSGGTWYYGKDEPSGDLYDAEETVKEGGMPIGDRLVLIRYPEGTVFPVGDRKEGVCYGEPVYDHGSVCILCVDHLEHNIVISAFDPDTAELREIAVIPLSDVRDCYNLTLLCTPLCLCRSGKDDLFEMIWPQKVSFVVSPHESLNLRLGDRVCFTEWFEDPEYREETVIRDLHTGEILERMDGDLRRMPDGSVWYIH